MWSQVQGKNGQEQKQKNQVQWSTSKEMDCGEPHMVLNEKM